MDAALAQVVQRDFELLQDGRRPAVAVHNLAVFPRANVGVCLFNLFNTNAVYAYFQTLDTTTPATYPQPASLVAARSQT